MKLVGAISTAVLSLTIGIGLPAYSQQEQHEQKEESKPSQEKEKKAQPEKSVKHEESATQERHAQQPKPEAQSGNHGRIPDDRFKANFGREHRFHVNQADYARDRRFQYGGYWFGFVQPWPSNWLYTQDVYVVEIDGVYYLCNANYPGVNITLNITM